MADLASSRRFEAAIYGAFAIEPSATHDGGTEAVPQRRLEACPPSRRLLARNFRRTPSRRASRMHARTRRNGDAAHAQQTNEDTASADAQRRLCARGWYDAERRNAAGLDAADQQRCGDLRGRAAGDPRLHAAVA